MEAGAEEQAAEIEALDAIFMDDFKLVDGPNSLRGARFEIFLFPESAPDVRLRMIFEHPLAYPDEPVVVTAHALAGVSAPKRKALQEFSGQVATENAGMPSVFEICENVKRWIEDNVGDVEEESSDSDVDGSQFETRDTSAAAKVEVVASKAIGTTVTVESFMAWRESFLLEINQAKAVSEKTAESNKKLTGRQLFEQSKAVVSEESESFWEHEAEGLNDDDITAERQI
jgi:RWD domain/DRG Family Regulatory Proteins, Tma46